MASHRRLVSRTATMRVILHKRRGALCPTDDRSKAALDKIKDGKEVVVEINSRPRNLRHLRLYWAIVHFLSENVFEHRDEEVVHLALKKATGLVYMFVDKNTGEIMFGEKSIAFDAMD